MTANETLTDTLKMLGYSENNGDLPQRIRNRAVTVINLVCEDLWRITSNESHKPIKSLADEIKLPARVPMSTVMYGVAMYITQGEADGEQQQVYTHLYNQNRAALSSTVTVKNTLPQVN